MMIGIGIVLARGWEGEPMTRAERETNPGESFDGGPQGDDGYGSTGR